MNKNDALVFRKLWSSIIFFLLIFLSVNGFACEPPDMSDYGTEKEVKRAYLNSELLFYGTVLNAQRIKKQSGNNVLEVEEVIFRVNKVLKGTVNNQETYKVVTLFDNMCETGIVDMYPRYIPPKSTKHKASPKNPSIDERYKRLLNSLWIVSIFSSDKYSGQSPFALGRLTRHSDGVFEDHVISKFKLSELKNKEK